MLVVKSDQSISEVLNGQSGSQAGLLEVPHESVAKGQRLLLLGSICLHRGLRQGVGENNDDRQNDHKDFNIVPHRNGALLRFFHFVNLSFQFHLLCFQMIFIALKSIYESFIFPLYQLLLLLFFITCSNRMKNCLVLYCVFIIKHELGINIKQAISALKVSMLRLLLNIEIIFYQCLTILSDRYRPGQSFIDASAQILPLIFIQCC